MDCQGNLEKEIKFQVISLWLHCNVYMKYADTASSDDATRAASYD